MFPGADSVLPRFAEPIPNVTVTVGRDALMACVVENLRNYKVAWVRVDTQTILSIHHHVITQNPRVSLSYNDHRSWYLHISNVQEVDRGWYMCQINTDPMRHRAGYLQVVVPPRMVGGEGPRELVVRESTEVRLDCRADGYPEPYVMWRREDGKDINYNGEVVNVVDGEVLLISRVSRLHMGAYLCIASNGVPPSISRRVLLRVQFPPMLSIPNQLEGAYLGQDVNLECQTEAFPSSINYWTTDNGDMIVSGDKFETSTRDQGYSKYMTLRIRNVTSRDFGSYQCVAKNSLGETDGLIKLEELPNPAAKSTATTIVIADSSGRNKFIHERYSKEENSASPKKGSSNGSATTIRDREPVVKTTPGRPPPDLRAKSSGHHISSKLLPLFRVNILLSSQLLVLLNAIPVKTPASKLLRPRHLMLPLVPFFIWGLRLY